MSVTESTASDSKPPLPSEIKENPQHPHLKNNSSLNPSVTFSIWPPSQSTRLAVVTRLIETLSTPSILSKRYGIVPTEVAAYAAHTIEEEAFAAIGLSADNDDDGLEILQIYSKEVSKRMLEIVKSHAASHTLAAASTDGTDENSVAGFGPVYTAYKKASSTVELEA